MSKHGFKELLVWQSGKKLAGARYKPTEQGKIARDRSLTDQMRRCASSIPSNIAEGDERDTDKDTVRFFCIAKGSLAELITHIAIAQEVGHLSGEEALSFLEQFVALGKMLGALINARTAGWIPIASRFSPLA